MYKSNPGTHRGYKNTRKGYKEFIGWIIPEEPIEGGFVPFIEIKINDFKATPLLSKGETGEYIINFDTNLGFNEKTILEILPVYNSGFTGDGFFIFGRSLLEGDGTKLHFHSYNLKDSLSNLFEGMTICIRIIHYE